MRAPALRLQRVLSRDRCSANHRSCGLTFLARGQSTEIGFRAALQPTCLVSSTRVFSTIQRGHDKQRESLFDKLGFAKDGAAMLTQRSLTELEQGFVREVQLLRDPVHDPADRARLEELKEAYVLLRDSNFRRNYESHNYCSNDAQLHVLVDGGAVFANANPEHQAFEYVDHSRRGTFAAAADERAQTGSLSGSGAGASVSFAQTQEAFRQATGVTASSSASARPYAAAEAHGPANGADVPFVLKLSFEEGLLGCSKRLTFSRRKCCARCAGAGTQAWRGKPRHCPQCLGRGFVHYPSATYHLEKRCNFCGGEGVAPLPPCAVCRGAGVTTDGAASVTVSVPPGTFTGAVFRLRGKGNDGVRGGRAGDLVVTAVAAEHRHLFRVGADLHAMLPLPLSTALLGGVVRVPALASGHRTSGTAVLRVPPCVRNGQVLSLRQHGLPSTARHGQPPLADSPHSPPTPTPEETLGQLGGSMYYHVLVLIPNAERLSGRQKGALSAYEQATAPPGPAAAAADTSERGATQKSAAPAAEQEARLRQCAELKVQFKHWLSGS